MIWQYCNRCKHISKDSNASPCNTCGYERENYEPKTNADRIRNMTDEELATFLGQVVYYCRGRQDNNWCKDCPLMTSRGCNNILIGEWLQAEVKEGNSNENT